MRRLIILAALAFAFAAPAVRAQEAQTYTSDKLDYVLDLPNATWRAVARADSEHEHIDFIYGDRSDGLLRIRKEVVEEGTSPADLARRDQDNKLRFQHGYVEGKQDNFPGRLKGIAASYEFTGGGKPMVGVIYYLQAEPRTIYVLHFTGSKDTLLRLRSQTDAIARSFRLK
ncbi:MAG: hypothetical protein QOF61_2512 [Acidobacteriota bacterium]|jgi:hypothetical protein|nr:hypothetical protein [Acidobacteriota bacterium]